MQTKLTINQSGDEYEQEADRVSEQVMRMSEPRLQRVCSCGGACPKCQTEQPDQERERLQTKQIGSSDLEQTPVPPIVHEVLRSPGQPLDPATRAFMEPRFGHNFSNVRVHADNRAAEAANAMRARAFTVGQDIVFAAGEYAPGAVEGKRLLAHEMTHVVQQSQPPSGGHVLPGVAHVRGHAATAPQLQRPRRNRPPTPPQGQEPHHPPPTLLIQSATSSMSDRQLHARYDAILAELDRHDLTPSDRRFLVGEAERVGEELAARAVRIRRTFDAAAVTRMRQHYTRAVQATLSGQHRECINELRGAIRALTGRAVPMQPGNEMQGTMAYLQRQGMVESSREILFVDATGRPINRGSGLRPDHPQTSVWDAVLAMSGGNLGYSVFGLSLMDNYHSIILTLDNTPARRGRPIVRWSDQTGRHGPTGWEEMGPRAGGHPSTPGGRGLDEYIIYFTQTIWDSQPPTGRAWPIIRLWRIRQPPATARTP